MTLKPPAGTDPTYDWSSYANQLSSSNTDKKRTAAAGLGIGLILKNILDDRETKNTSEKIAQIQSDKSVMDSLITQRFEEKGTLLEKIEKLGGEAVFSTDEKGNTTLKIDNQEKIKDAMRVQELELVKKNLPLAGFSNNRTLSEGSRKEAIERADLAFEKLMLQPLKKYDWSNRTKEESQAQAEKLYRNAAGSLDKDRYRGIIAKKFTQMTGSYVSDPEKSFLEEARRSVEGVFNLRDTEYSTLVSAADRKANLLDESDKNEILESFAAGLTNPDVSTETKNEIKRLQSLIDHPKVNPISPTAAIMDEVTTGASNGNYGETAAKNVSKFASDYKLKYEQLSLVAGANHDPEVLFLASLPVNMDDETNREITIFENPEGRADIILNRAVTFFEKQQRKTPAYPENAAAQEEYVNHQILKIRSQKLGISGSKGSVSTSDIKPPAGSELAYNEKMHGHLKKPIIDNLAKLYEDKVGNASEILTEEYKLSELSERYKSVTGGSAYNVYKSLLATNINRITKIQNDQFEGQDYTTVLTNNMQIIDRALGNIITRRKNHPDLKSTDPKIKKQAELLRDRAIKMEDAKLSQSPSFIATIQTLQEMTSSWGASGHINGRWYREQGLTEVSDLLYQIAYETDVSFMVPDITEVEAKN
jgi:hypothetical protein